MNSETKPKIPMNHVESEAISIENGRKIDRVITLLEGQGPDAPGLLHTIRKHSDAINQMEGKVNIMWRVHVWVLCTASAGVGTAFGFYLKTALSAMVKHP